MIVRFVVLLVSSLFLFAGSGWAREELSSIWSPVTAPSTRNDSSWLHTDFLEDAQLHYKHLFSIDFEEDGTAWIASPTGLIKYDGFHWSTYTTDHGLPSDFVRCVLVTADGTLWVGTDQGAGIFDGKTFTTQGSENNLAGPSVRRIQEDGDGGLWFCCDPWPDDTVSGGLTHYKNGQWHSYTRKDGLPSLQVMDYYRDSHGRQFVLTAQGVAILEEGVWVNPFHGSGIQANIPIWDIVDISGLGLVLSGENALLVLKDQQWTRIPVQSTQPLRLCKTQDGDLVTIEFASDTYRAFHRWEGDHFEPASVAFPSLKGVVEQIAVAPDGAIWGVGFNCLSRWDLAKQSQWHEYEAIPDPTLVDPLGRVWFVGDRILRKDGDAWFQSSVVSDHFVLDSQKQVWSCSDNHVYLWNDESVISFSGAEKGYDDIQEIFPAPSGELWVWGVDAEKNERLYAIDSSGWGESANLLEENITLITAHADHENGIWILTRSRKSGEIRLSHHYTGLYREIPLDPTIQSVIQADKQVKLYSAPDNNIWVYGEGLLAVYKHLRNPNQVWDHVINLNNRTVISVLCRGNQEWIAVSAFSIHHGGIAVFEGQRAYWDFYQTDVRSFGCITEEKTLYFGGNECLHVIPPNWKREPIRLPLPLQSIVLSMVRESVTSFWLKTVDTVLHYRSDKVAPETIVKQTSLRILEGSPVTIECYGRQRNTSKTKTTSLLFSWQVNDGPWTNFQPVASEGIVVSGLRPGQHTVQIRARDGDGDVDSSPAEVRIEVFPVSVFDTTGFKFFMGCVFLLVSYLAIYALRARRHLKIHAQNLESLIERRTVDLRESEKKYRELVQNANSMILRLTHDGNILFINEFAQSFFGYDHEEIFGQSILETLIPKQESTGRDLESHLLAILASPTSYPAQEMECTRKNKSRAWIVWTFKALEPDRGETHEVLCIGSDVTEQKELTQKLIQSQKMEAVGQMASGVAHNINNLLTGILGNLSILLPAASRDSKECLENAYDAALRSAKLVKELLAFCRKTAIRLQPVHINDILEEVCSTIREKMDRRIIVSLDTMKNPPSVVVDLNQIQTVLMNLCTNARDAIEKKMQETCHENQEYEIRIETLLKTIGDGEYLLIRISDTGCGMDEESQTHIFEPFFTTKQTVGTGLGLASAFGILKQHQGWIDFSSQPGEGSCFELYIPSASPAGEASAKTEQVATILFADDEELIRDLGKSLLASHGYRVLLAKDGQECLDIFEEKQPEILLTILDLSMPKRSGLDVFHEIKAKDPEAKIIISSGYSDLEFMDENTRKTLSGVLSKPYRPDDLLRLIRQILDA